MLCLKCSHDENTHTCGHADANIQYMLRDMSAVGCLPSRSDMLIACRYSLPSCQWQLMMSPWDFRPPLLLADTLAHRRYMCIYKKTPHTDAQHAHADSDRFSLATSMLSSNVLIMIGFVCNYKHSETPISKNFIEFRPMGILGCFSKMRTAPHIHHHYPHLPIHTLTNTRTRHTSLQKQTLLFEPCVAFAYTLKALLPRAPRSTQVVCACHLVLSPGLSCFRG